MSLDHTHSVLLQPPHLHFFRFPNVTLASSFAISRWRSSGYSGGLPFQIEGAIVSTADIVGQVPEGDAVELLMDTVEIKGSNVPLLRQVLDGGLKLESRNLGGFLEDNIPEYSNPKPLFRTTFLDDKLRICRDQDGKLFVYSKLSESTSPTDYSQNPADLGITKLAESISTVFL